MSPIDVSVSIPKLPSKQFLGLSTAFAIADSGVLRISGLIKTIQNDWLVVLQISEWALWALVAVFGVIVYLEHQKNKLANQKLSVTFPLPHTHFWQEAKQLNGSIYTQINADVFIKNKTDKPLGLSFVKLKNPGIKAPVVHSWALIKDKSSPNSATTVHSYLKIEAFDSNLVRLSVIIAGSLGLAKSVCNTIDATLILVDEDGIETEIKTTFNIQ